jgi:hypothetical protein
MAPAQHDSPGAPDGGEACPGPGWRNRVPEPPWHACRPCLNPWALLLHRGMRVCLAPVAESVIRVGGYNLWTVGFHHRDRRVSAT